MNVSGLKVRRKFLNVCMYIILYQIYNINPVYKIKYFYVVCYLTHACFANFSVTLPSSSTNPLKNSAVWSMICSDCS